MLPFLPALILLLLQGPSNFERLAADARLPAALEAIHRHMAEPGTVKLSEREEQALASLIASGSGAHLTQTLLSFLCGDVHPSEEMGVIARDLSANSLTQELPASRPQDGFERSQRSRDGPRNACALG